MKKNLLKAAIPFIMLGSPAWAASSIRSISRGKVKKAAVQSSKEQAQPELSQAGFENPFGGFGGAHSSYQVASHEPANVIGFLAEEGLLTATSESPSQVTGNDSRKEFLALFQCVAGATYNGKELKAVNSYTNTTTSTTISYFYLTYHTVSSGTSLQDVNHATFNNAKAACLTPKAVPTLSQWGQALLMMLLGLIGFKARFWRKKGL